MPRKDAYTGPISAQAQQDLVSEGIENYELPKSVVMKIAKSSIPDNVKLQKETVLSLVKGSTVFINYLAATAHDVALSKQHKSISASDVLKALEMLEFSDMVEQLQGELQVYRQITKIGDKKLEKKKASTSNPTTGAAPSSSRKPNSLSLHPITQEGEPPLQQGDHYPAFDPMNVDDGAVDEGDRTIDEGNGTMDVEDRHVDEQDVRDDEEVGVEDEISEGDPIVESDNDGSADELEDKVALEEEELRKDHQALGEPPTAMLHED